MDNRSILVALDEEIARLQDARRVLAGMGGNDGHAEPKKKRSKRHLSPEARAKIAAAQKRRWAAVRKAGE